MQTYGSNGIRYSEKYLDSDFIDFILKPAAAQVTASGMEDLKAGAKVEDVNIDAFYARALSEVSQDADTRSLADQAFRSGFSPEKGLDHFKTALAAPLKAEADKETSLKIKHKYEVRLENGLYTHFIDDEAILEIPGALSGSLSASKQAEILINFIFVTIDFIMIILAIFGVSIAIKKDRLIKVLAKPVENALQRFANWCVEIGLANIAKKGKRLDLILKLMLFFRGGTNIKKIILLFIEEMSLLEKIATIIEIIAAIGLLIATLGASVAAKVLQLVVAIGYLIADILRLIASFGEPGEF